MITWLIHTITSLARSAPLQVDVCCARADSAILTNALDAAASPPDQLAAEYLKAGRANQMRVVPAGPAFAASVAKRPDLNLYAPDKRHPSLAGTYLGAAVVMASVFKKSPVGNTYTAGLPADVAAHLQAVAWETVQSFKQ